MLTQKPRFPIREIALTGFLPSFLKRLIYRFRGYRIGKAVRFGLGSVVSGRDVDIGDGVSLGFMTIIRGQTIRLGNRVDIGSFSFLDTPHLEIGDGTKINEQVMCGGLQFPDSRLVIGRNCQVMQMTFINPTKSITIGDDTGIGGDCLIFGHSSWLSKFEGYPVDFRPIEIGSSVSLSWRVFVLAGVKIGDGAVIGANSLVNHTIPPRCLAVGFPARVVAKAPYFPRTISESAKPAILRDILSDMVGYLRGFGLACDDHGNLITVVQKSGRGWFRKERAWRLRVESESVGTRALEGGYDNLHVLLSLQRLPDEVRRELGRRGVAWIDIQAKERSDYGNDLAEEVVQFLRRYGVRFNRVAL
jgi:acetyltransferase-like isoleucine patch superfamily enzyme